MCDMFSGGDIHHLVMPCPSVQDMREKMFRNIFEKGGARIEQASVEKPCQVFWWLLGKKIEHLNDGEMRTVRCIARHTISNMYMSVLHCSTDT